MTLLESRHLVKGAAHTVFMGENGEVLSTCSLSAIYPNTMLTSQASYNSEILNSFSDTLQTPYPDSPQSGPKFPFHGVLTQT